MGAGLLNKKGRKQNRIGLSQESIEGLSLEVRGRHFDHRAHVSVDDPFEA
jgi:hypothetical protein